MQGRRWRPDPQQWAKPPTRCLHAAAKGRSKNNSSAATMQIKAKQSSPHLAHEREPGAIVAGHKRFNVGVAARLLLPKLRAGAAGVGGAAVSFAAAHVAAAGAAGAGAAAARYAALAGAAAAAAWRAWLQGKASTWRPKARYRSYSRCRPW